MDSNHPHPNKGKTAVKTATGEAPPSDKVILIQTLLRVEETFVYKIPPMRTSGGHRAEDWNLAQPVATCGLMVVRQDNKCLIQLLGKRPKVNGPKGSTEDYMFAQAKIVWDDGCDDATVPTTAASSDSVDTTFNGEAKNTGALQQQLKASSKGRRPVEYWVESVVDSSRYFVIRCEDDRSTRQAFVGIGLRERNDAMNFKMSIADFVKAIDRERMATQMYNDNVNSGTMTALHGGARDEGSTSRNEEADGKNVCVTSAVSKLSLKAGEKIHVDLADRGPGARTRTKIVEGDGKPSLNNDVSYGGGLLLRKPPPPAGVDVVTSKDESSRASDMTNFKDCDACSSSPSDNRSAENEVVAPAELSDVDEDWGAFEGGEKES